MPAPARRSRRTRNEPPEIVPPKSDGEGEDNDEEGDEEEEDEQKEDEQGGESEKSDADSSEDGKSGPSARRSAKAKKTGPAAKTRRAARTSRKPTTRGPRKTSSPVTTRRRKRRASNSSDEQPSKGDEDASSGEGSEAEADEPAKPQTPPPTRGRRRVATRGKQRQAAKNAKSGDEESKGGNASSGSDQDEGGEEKDDAADNSDSAAASTQKSNDEEGSKDEDNEDEDSSDNEPLSVIVKRKREALKKKQATSKHVPSRESSVGDDQSEDERPRKRLSSAASSGNDDGGDADAESDSVTPKKKNARANPRQKRQTRTTRKVGSAKSSGDEGDADEPPHKRTRRRGRTNKAVSSPKGKASSAVSTNDEGSSDESSKGGSRRRGPRSTMSKSRSNSRSASPVDQDGEKDKDDNASSNDDKSLNQKEGDDASESKVEEQDETGSMEKEETKKSMDVDESSEPDEKAIKNKNEKPKTRQARSRSNSVADEDASGEERGSEAETSRVSRRSRRKRRKPNKLGEEDSADEQEATSKPAASEPKETKAEEEETSSDKEESHRPRRKGSKSGQSDDESDSKDANVSEKLKKEASPKVENESVADKISEGADERVHAGADEPEPKNVEPVDSGDEDDDAENVDAKDEIRSKVDGRSAAPADEEEFNVIQVRDEAKDHDSAHPNDTKQPPSKGDDDDVDSEEMKPESEDAEKSEADEGSKTGDFQNGTTQTTVEEISAPEAVDTVEQKDESAASEERIVKDATLAETLGSPVESKAVAGDVELQRLRKESPRHTVKSPEASTPHGAGAEDAVPVAEHPPTTDETESKEMTIEPNNVQGDNVVAEQSIEVSGEAKPLSPSGEGDEDKADDQVVDMGSIPGHSVTTEDIAADVKDQDAKADSIVEEKDPHLLEEPKAGSSSIESAHKRLSEMPSVEGAGPHESLDVDAPAPLDTESPTAGPSAATDYQPTAPAEDKTSEQEAKLSAVNVPKDFTKTDKDVEKSEPQTAGEPVGSDSAEEARRLTPEVEASLQSKSTPMVKTEEEEDQFHDAHMEMPSEPPSGASLAGAAEIGNPNLQGQAQGETDGLSVEAPKESLPAAASEEGATSALVQGNDNGNVLEAKKSDPVSRINNADGVATEPDSAKPGDISAAPRVIGPIEASIRASFQKQRSGGMSSPNAIARIDASKATTNLVPAAATARTDPMPGMKPIEAVQLETVQKIGVTGASLTATPSPPALTETTELDSGNTATIANGPDERDTLHADPMVVAQHMQTSFAHSANASFPLTGAPPVVLARNVSELQPSHFVPSAVETATATTNLSIEVALEQPIPQLATKAGDLGPKTVQSVEASDDPNDAKQKEPSETPKMKRRFVGTPMKSPEAIPELLPVPLEFEYKVRFGPPPIQEDAEEPPMVSPMDLVDKDKLKRVKTVLYATGSRAHRGSGFERIFAEYWDAMALRLSDRLSSHTSERCQRAIDNFLKTPKLRKLHNKFIMSIMRRAQRDVATYGEVSVHVPMKWRTRIRTVSAPPVEKFQERLPVVSSSLNTPMFGPAEPCYREAWDQPKPHINPLGNERRRQKTLITPKPEIASCSLPGALTIDPLVRKIAEEDGMEVSDLAIWLMVVAVKEHAGNVLKTSIAHKEAMEQSDLPPRPLAFPRPLAGAITLHTKPDLPLDGKSILADKGTRMSRTLNALDIYASLGTMAMGHIGSLGGSFSRSTLERSLHASFDQLSVVPKDNFTNVQNYIIDQIFAEARTRKVPPKPRDDDRETRAPLENHVNANASPMMRHQNSFAVPPPAPAQPRAVDTSTAANVQPIPASAPPLTTAPVVALGTNTAAATSVAETEALNAMPRGMGRGAKNLAALMRRTTTSNSPGPEDSNAGPAPESKADETTPAEPSPQAPPPATTAAPTNLPSEESKGNDEGEDAGGQRRGKGFGIKNLARMLAKKDVDPADN